MVPATKGCIQCDGIGFFIRAVNEAWTPEEEKAYRTIVCVFGTQFSFNKVAFSLKLSGSGKTSGLPFCRRE